MFDKLGYNENLKALVDAKKADESIAIVVKENLDRQNTAQEGINKAKEEIQQLNATNEDKINEKMKLSIFNIRDYMALVTEIRSIKKQIKQKSEEVELYNREIEAVKIKNEQLENEINTQFKIYQENELYTKAIEKIDKRRIDLSAEFYTDYLNHMNKYNSSVYSIEKESKLPEPKTEALITVLNVLKKSEENEDKKTKIDGKKKTTRKKAAREEDKSTENKEDVKKKTTRKKVIEEEHKSTEKKEIDENRKTTRKKVVGEEDKSTEKKEDVKKKTTRKKVVEEENKSTEKKEIDEKKKTTRKKAEEENNKTTENGKRGKATRKKPIVGEDNSIKQKSTGKKSNDFEKNTFDKTAREALDDNTSKEAIGNEEIVNIASKTTTNK